MLPTPHNLQCTSPPHRRCAPIMASSERKARLGARTGGGKYERSSSRQTTRSTGTSPSRSPPAVSAGRGGGEQRLPHPGGSR
eukprot:scaffold16141_cov101-Isochrysis_galbana.AAC.3